MRTCVLIAIVSIALSSCATIIGGRHYNANIIVDDYRAQIIYNGNHVGYGNANVLVPRRNANQVTITIRQDMCETQEFHFRERTFRGGAFLGTVVLWTGLYINEDESVYIPLPWGTVVDIATGALWKPDITEEGIYKIDFNNYNYLINYTGCKVLEDRD